MPVYEYVGNLDPNDGTVAIWIDNIFIPLHERADLTSVEYDAASLRFILNTSGLPATVFPSPRVTTIVTRPELDSAISTLPADDLPEIASLRTLGGGPQQAVAGDDSRLGDVIETDGPASTPSLRTLGTSGTSAAAGNDARLSNTRTPTAHVSTHVPGGSDALPVDQAANVGSLRTLATNSATKAAPGVSDAAPSTPSLRTLGAGPNQACAGNDGRLGGSDFLSHANRHNYPDGEDLLAYDQAANVPSLRTLGAGAAQAAAGNDPRFTILADGGITQAIVDAKGDLIVGTANDVVSRFGVGANGKVLTANSAQTTGLEWADSADSISALSRTRVAVTSSPYTILTTDGRIIGVNVAGACTINLPSASSIGSGHTFIIKDESGNATTNNITLTRAGSDTIEGSVSKIINVPYGFLRVYSTGSAWMIV